MATAPLAPLAENLPALQSRLGEAVMTCALDLLRAHTPASAHDRCGAVAREVSAIGLDDVAVACALVGTGCSAQAWPALFAAAPPVWRRLLDALSRVRGVAWSELQSADPERVRGMFLAIANDLRVAIIVLCERIIDLRALESLDAAQRTALARETMRVQAPLANRLGVWQIKWELEDRAFRQLQPDTYAELKRQIAQKRDQRTQDVDEVMRTLHEELSLHGITGKVTGRPKHIYSIYNKMRRKGVGFDELYDVLATRVIVQDVTQCYAVLGIIHGLWEPIRGEFDDYVARPKPNGYASLHTAVVGPGGRPVEVQIRTQEMHDFAEHGVAAHWAYKESGPGATTQAMDLAQRVTALRQLSTWQHALADELEAAADAVRSDSAPESSSAMPDAGSSDAPDASDDAAGSRDAIAELLHEQIYVLSPTGEVFDLPQGATPIDFAYRVHSAVGHTCKGAKVNGAIVPLDTALETGDRVEVLRHKHPRPSRDWINPHLGYVRTNSARQKIRSFFRSQQRDEAITAGRELLTRAAHKLGVAHPDVANVVRSYGLADESELLAKLGFGDINEASLEHRLLDLDLARREKERQEQQPQDAKSVIDRAMSEATPLRSAPEVSKATVAGVSDVLTHLARCCNPLPGDTVRGFITRGRGVAVHRDDCPNIVHCSEPQQLVDVTWGSTSQRGAWPLHLVVTGRDHSGLVRDTVALATSEGASITDVRARARKDEAVVHLRLTVKDTQHAVRLMARMAALPLVDSVTRAHPGS